MTTPIRSASYLTRAPPVSVAEFAARVRALVAEGKVRLAHLEMAARREHSPALRRNLAAVREQLPEVVLT